MLAEGEGRADEGGKGVTLSREAGLRSSRRGQLEFLR
jgi:hypothetical protein